MNEKSRKFKLFYHNRKLSADVERIITVLIMMNVGYYCLSVANAWIIWESRNFYNSIVSANNSSRWNALIRTVLPPSPFILLYSCKYPAGKMNQIISKQQQMGRFRPKMDATRVSKMHCSDFYTPNIALQWLQALHTLGFSSGTGLIDISVEEIQNKFSLKMQQVCLSVKIVYMSCERVECPKW